MCKIICILIITAVSTLCYSQPAFKKIETFDYKNYNRYNKVIFHDDMFFVYLQGEIFIFNDSFELKDSITRMHIFNHLKDELNLTDLDYDMRMQIKDFDFDKKGRLWITTHYGATVYNVENKEIVKSYHYKNSVMGLLRVFNVLIDDETVAFNVDTVAIFYIKDINNGVMEKVVMPLDTTGAWSKLPLPDNAALHQGKYYYLSGLQHNLIVYDGEEFKFYDHSIYTDIEKPKTTRRIKAHKGSIYFFEDREVFRLVQFNDGTFTVKDLQYSGVFAIPNDCVLYEYNLTFDKSDNMWASFIVINSLTEEYTEYIMRYKSDTDYNVYPVKSIIENYEGGTPFISVCDERGEIYVGTSNAIYKADLKTDVENKTENMPSLFLLSIFPNPAIDRIVINFSTLPAMADKLKLKLYNYLGTEIYSLDPEIKYNAATGLGTIETGVGHLQAGFYILTLNNGDNIKSRNIIIIK